MPEAQKQPCAGRGLQLHEYTHALAVRLAVVGPLALGDTPLLESEV